MYRSFFRARQRLIFPIFLMLSFLLCAGTANAQSAKGNWDPRFTPPPGLDGPVYAMVSSGNNLYVGGAFSKAGGAVANGVAKWDGTNWSALGGGVGGTVYALAVSGTDLYVGGAFHTAGGIGATNIARWNGVSWQGVGGGLDHGVLATPMVFALYASGSNLFAGGQFQMAGDQPAVNVARWDGSAWHVMDTGVFLPDAPESWGTVRAITGDGTNVYVGGVFIQAGNIAATNLARWDGNSWSSMGDCTGGLPTYTYQGNQLYGSVLSLTMHQGALFVGGNFGNAGGVPAQGLARWDGLSWQNIGDVSDGTVNALESFSGSLYLAGTFTSAGGIVTTNAAIWTSGVWSELNAETYPVDFVSCLAHFGTQMYLGGTFGLLNGVSAGNVVQWNGNNWLPLGSGTGNSLDGEVSALATDGSNIYAAGSFGAAGTNAASSLAKWDGAHWSPVGSLLPGANTFLDALAVVGSNLYVSGFFTIPDAGVTNLAVWDGTVWKSPDASLTDDALSGLFAVGNTLYFPDFIGPISSTDGVNLSGVPWDIASVNEKLATDGTNLYIAKTLLNSNDNYSVQVARWDGMNLTLMGGSFANLQASALGACGTSLYLAGSLTTDDNAPALYSWNGTSWQSMGSPIASTGSISAIVPLRGNLYVAGSFTSLNDVPVNNIAQWNGATWLDLGGGISDGPGSAAVASVSSMVAVGRKIVVAGQFTSAGPVDAENFAIWNETPEIRLANMRKEPTGEFAFDLLGIAFDQLEIQTSATLTNWSSLGLVTLTSATQTFHDSPPTNSAPRYYRARFVKSGQ